MEKSRIYEIIGEASMCWSDTPKGIFDSTRAKKLGDEIVKDFVSMEDERTELIEVVSMSMAREMSLTSELVDLRDKVKELEEALKEQSHDTN